MINEERKNTHMTHLEDLVLLGESGLNELNNYLDSLINKQDNVRMTQKIDGAPALICWSHIEGYPDNSICLKSFVNGPKNAMSSIDEIEERYGDRPGMVLMLRYGLYLSQFIPEGEAWQGDCLFTKQSKKERQINGKSYITFQPNKIIYAFSEDNPGYENVKQADFGICFHTIYQGKLGALSQKFDVDASKLLVPSNIYILSPAIDFVQKFDNIDLNELNHLENKLLQDPNYETLCNNEIFMKYWNTFENFSLSDKKRTTLDIETFFDDLKSYVDTKMAKEFQTKYDKLKTDKGREKAQSNYQESLKELQNILEQNKQTIVNIAETINCVADIKMNLLNSLGNTNTNYSTFYQRQTGEYEPSSGEGIAMFDNSGNIVKLIDRSSFSNVNRDNTYTSGFQHEDLNEDIENTAVLIWGRMNPITKGHVAMIDFAKEQGSNVFVYLSHSQDSKKNPLPYDRKIYWAQKAVGDCIQESNAKSIVQALQELQDYDNLIYICGSDREKEMNQLFNKYNGKPDKKGNIPFNFKTIEVRRFGDDRITEDISLAQCSASKARNCVKEDDFELFKQIVPFNEDDAQKLFNELKEFME